MKDYNKYQLEWMIAHGYTIENLIQQLDEMREMYEAVYTMHDIKDYTIADLFAEWEFNTGFNGELWACYSEWLDNNE